MNKKIIEMEKQRKDAMLKISNKNLDLIRNLVNSEDLKDYFPDLRKKIEEYDRSRKK